MMFLNLKKERKSCTFYKNIFEKRSIWIILKVRYIIVNLVDDWIEKNGQAKFVFMWRRFVGWQNCK